MDDETRRAFQTLADQNAQFYAYASIELIDIKAMLEVLLGLEEERLVDRGATRDEARTLIQDRLSERQRTLAVAGIYSPDPVPTDISGEQ